MRPHPPASQVHGHNPRAGNQDAAGSRLTGAAICGAKGSTRVAWNASLNHRPSLRTQTSKAQAEPGSLIADDDVSACHVVSASDDGNIARQPGGHIGERNLSGLSDATASVCQPFISIQKRPRTSVRV
jgi:hypothetical protein